MSKVVIVDNSALIPLFFDEEETGKSLKLFAAEGLHLVAPGFLLTELSNVLVTGIKRKRITREEASSYLRDFQRIGLELRVFPVADRCPQMLDVAVSHGLSFYDAIYLVLAQLEGAELASFDRKLRSAAKKEGVDLFRF